MHTPRRFPRSVVLLAAVFALVPFTYAAGADDGAKEKQLLETLRSGVPADKAIACKELAVYGTPQAVEELAKLLSDEQLASWSRIALEAIPGPEAGAALRKSLDSVKGKLLVGSINSIGVRRDEDSVEPLTKHLQDDSADVASAAAVALGHIGNDAATKALRGSLAGAAKSPIRRSPKVASSAPSG